MFINLQSRRAAFTLVELMVATGLTALVAIAIGMLAYYSSRSFVAMANYTDLAKFNQLALDKMSRDIRQSGGLTAYATNSITLLDVSTNSLRFTYDPTAQTLVRVSGGTTNQYLTNCTSFQFFLYQHTVLSNTFDCYVPAAVTNARVVQMIWTCARQIKGVNATTANSESAQIALRNH